MDRGRTEASTPTDGLQEVCGAGDREGRPYGRVQELPAWVAGGVEPRPYGVRCKERLRRDDVGIVPYGGRITLFIHVQDK